MMEVDKFKLNGRAPSRNERAPSRNQEKRVKGFTVAETVAAVLSQNGKLPQENGNRLNAMKKVAEEQRKKVRENRERLADEKLASQAKRNEELRSQIQTVLEGLIDDMRVDVFSSIDKRLKEEKDALKDELKRELATGNSSFREEIERNTLNGETFDVRFARVKNEVENSFKDAVKTESEQIEKLVMSSLENNLESEKYRWENRFRREGIKRIKATEDAVRTDFRVGLEDSQKQCSEIIANVEARTASLEQKLRDRIAVMDAEAAASVQESERQTFRLIVDRLDQRDKVLRDVFKNEAEKLHQEVKKIKDASNRKSKFCTVI